MNQLTQLYKIDGLVEGTVIKRPSYYICSPYVADIGLAPDAEVIAHTASLGCCGLADNGATILMIPVEPNLGSKVMNKAGLRCEYSVQLAVIQDKLRNKEQIVGIHPKIAEKLVQSALKNDCFSRLKIKHDTLRPETAIYIKDHVDSRFDFTGQDIDGTPFIMEVKNVPLADFEDVTAKDRITMNFDDRDYDDKVAYFPDGYRKKQQDTVSPRALKHIKELTWIKKNDPRFRCIMCYVIQRTDVNRFQPSVIDPEYRTAFYDALNAGVEVYTMVVHWTREGEAYFVRDNLPIA